MTTLPEHDRFAHPFWMVQGVFDPDEPWRDFAYTIGLASRGRPELHIYCHPGLGEDAAPDWRFSQDDMVRVLNQAASRVLEGALAVGDEWTERYDAGLSTVRFRLDPPGDREELEAFGIAAGADVLPVRWSLERAPRGPRQPLSAEEEDRARASYAEILSGLPFSSPAPPGWSVPRAPSFDLSQPYGPRTPLVMVRAAQIWTMPPRELATLISLAADVDRAGSVSYACACAAAEARPHGLDDAVERLRDDVSALCEQFASPMLARTWRETVRLWLEALPGPGSPSERTRFEHSLRGLLADAVLGALSVELLGECATDSTRLAGLGPLLSTFVGEGTPPAEEWVAGAAVLDVVRSLIDRTDPPSLVDLAQNHARARDPGDDYDAVTRRLLGWAMTSAASCSPVLAMMGVTKAVGVAQVIAERGLDGIELQSWASCVTSALTHRARLGNDDVATLCEPMRTVLPGLEKLLNAPL